MTYADITFEPWRIKMVEPLYMTTKEERQRLLISAGYNLFRIPSDKILIDLLTDSGLSSMSTAQWSAMISAREAYAGSEAFFAFEKAVKEFSGMPYILPVHQGRGAEKILFSLLGGQGKTVIGNTHFDTTRANIEVSGAVAVDMPIDEASQHDYYHPFKGNVNTKALQSFIEKNGAKNIPCFVMTVTNNSVGGQPASLANVRAVKDILKANNIPLLLDAARFAENAWFISQREEGYSHKTILQISQELFSLADCAMMSCKKDGLANVGGFIALRDEELFQKVKERLILWEGFATYGGLAARDMAALAQGFKEVMDSAYLQERIGQVAELGRLLDDASVPIVHPSGGHAIFVDAGKVLPHIPREQFPGHALACALYLESGVRACEIGTLMFDSAARYGELMRLAIPRRMYTSRHLAYVAHHLSQIAKSPEKIGGMEIIDAPPTLRHFSATLRPLKLSCTGVGLGNKSCSA